MESFKDGKKQRKRDPLFDEEENGLFSGLDADDTDAGDDMWLLRDELDLDDELVGGKPLSRKCKMCCGICCGGTCLGLFIYFLWLLVVFRGVPEVTLVSLVPQCKDAHTCLAYGGGMGVPFKATFAIANPNNADMKVSARIKLYTPDGVREIGQGDMYRTPVKDYYVKRNGEVVDLVNYGTATIYMQTWALQANWIDFFFREGEHVYTTPSTPISEKESGVVGAAGNITSSTGMLDAVTSSGTVNAPYGYGTGSAFGQNPTVYKMVMRAKVRLGGLGIRHIEYQPVIYMERTILVGNPALAFAGGLEHSNLMYGLDPNYWNQGPAPPSVDMSLPWQGTGLGATTDDLTMRTPPGVGYSTPPVGGMSLVDTKEKTKEVPASSSSPAIPSESSAADERTIVEKLRAVKRRGKAERP